MTDKSVFSEEDILCSHQLLIRFDQMADGTVAWRVIPDDVIAQTRAIGSVCMAAEGAPLAALGIRALWKLCEDGLIYHALEAACGVQIGVGRLLADESREEAPQLELPMESIAVH